MKRMWICVLLALGALSSPARANAPKLVYERFELPNGLAVYVIEDHKAPIVYEVLWFGVGSKDEVANRTGFAHLFEHLMFKGSAHLADGMMDKLLEGAGGGSSAFTTRDMTVYFCWAASSFLEMVLWQEADRLAGLLDTFEKAKLDNQRDVVLNERRHGYENQPYGLAPVLLSEALWPKAHGYHWRAIGYPADLKAANVADVSAFFKNYYVPNNATMVVAGDVNAGEVKRLVEKYFAWIPRGAEPVRPRYAVPPPITRQISLEATDDVKVPRVFLSWRAPAKYTAEEPIAALSAAILGDGKSSRLYKRLVYDKKLAQSVEVDYRGAELGGELTIDATAKPGVDPQQLIQEISDEVARLSSAPPTLEEVVRAQRGHEARFLLSLESTRQRAIQLAEYVVQAKDANYLANDLGRYRAVTAAQVTEVTARYLKPTSRVVLTIKPGKKAVSP